MNIDALNKEIMFGNWDCDQLDSIYMALKYARNQLARDNKRSLRLGDTVQFTSSRSGQTVVGTVKKINRKTVIVHTPGTNWRVPAEMLELASELAGV